MKRYVLILLTLFVICSELGTGYDEAQENNSASDTKPDKVAIKDAIAGYLIAINERDAVAASRYWSENGEWVGEDGSRSRGPKKIAAALQGSFATDPEGMTVALRNLTVRLISPTVAIEDGLAVVSIPNQPDSSASYAVVHVKENGAWKISAVRETVAPEATATQSSELESLSWLIGQWHDEAEDGLIIATRCDWTEGNHSLRRSFQVSDDGQVLKKGTQIIVWDARLGKIRSWMFDSEGGFGNGIWERQSPSVWVVDSEFQLADGGVATATNVYSAISENSFTFASANRTVDGVMVDDTPSIIVHRKSGQVGMAPAAIQTQEQIK